MLTNPDQITKVCKDGIDAVTKSTSALTGGASEIGQHFIATAQKTAASQNDAFKEALETKNSEELAELHAKWTADWMETTISHFNRLSQLTSKVVQQTYEPIQAHLDATSRQIKNGAEG
jgi:hypothetical protein